MLFFESILDGFWIILSCLWFFLVQSFGFSACLLAYYTLPYSLGSVLLRFFTLPCFLYRTLGCHLTRHARLKNEIDDNHDWRLTFFLLCLHCSISGHRLVFIGLACLLLLWMSNRLLQNEWIIWFLQLIIVNITWYTHVFKIAQFQYDRQEIDQKRKRCCPNGTFVTSPALHCFPSATTVYPKLAPPSIYCTWDHGYNLRINPDQPPYAAKHYWTSYHVSWPCGNSWLARFVS